MFELLKLRGVNPKDQAAPQAGQFAATAPADRVPVAQHGLGHVQNTRQVWQLPFMFFQRDLRERSGGTQMDAPVGQLVLRLLFVNGTPRSEATHS